MFKWIKKTKKPVLGICLGAQIISKIYQDDLSIKQNQVEIGEKEIEKTAEANSDPIFKEFKALKVYALHQNFFSCPKKFKILAKSKKSIQAIGYENKYGVLFHPEVSNSSLILNFIDTEP